MLMQGHHCLALPWQQSLSSYSDSYILSQDILYAPCKQMNSINIR